MNKAREKQQRQQTHHHRRTTASHQERSKLATYIKEFSKKVLHDYVIPMTRNIEHRLLRLEQSL